MFELNLLPHNQVDCPYTPQWTRTEEQKYGALPFPHWLCRKGRSAYKGTTYQSTKVLGEIYDMIEEPEPIEFEDEMNIYLRRTIEKAAANNPDQVKVTRKEMKEKLFQFNQEVSKEYSGYDREDEIGKRSSDKNIRGLCMKYRRQIEQNHCNDDLASVFAILYEQTYFASRDRLYFDSSKQPYMFAWSVGHDYLTRIIADGDAQSHGLGIAPTVMRGHERSVFFQKKYKR